MSDCGRKKLTIVFCLEADRSINNVPKREEVVASRIQSVMCDDRALKIIVDIMKRTSLSTDFDVDGKKIALDSYVKDVERKGAWNIPVTANGILFRFGLVSALKHSFISIEELSSSRVACWEDWVAPFLEEKSFVQAWLSDVDYDHWQNAKDVLEYEAVGRDHTGLPKRSNGLPPPLEQTEIDISDNPGRWSLKCGYVEAIGAKMWLSNLFWERVGEDRKRRLISERLFEVKEINASVVKLIAAETCFSDDCSAYLQSHLRNILFG